MKINLYWCPSYFWMIANIIIAVWNFIDDIKKYFWTIGVLTNKSPIACIWQSNWFYYKSLSRFERWVVSEWHYPNYEEAQLLKILLSIIKANPCVYTKKNCKTKEKSRVKWRIRSFRFLRKWGVILG